MKKTLFLLLGLVCLTKTFVIKQENGIEIRDTVESTTKAPIYIPKPNTTVCYDYVGCFDNNYPFNNTGFYLPIDPEIMKTTFLLFTRENPVNEEILTYKDYDSLRNSKFNKNLPLKIIVHGFGNSRETLWLNKMKDEILKADYANVLIVCWGIGAAVPFYNNASSNIRVVGKEITLIVNGLRKVFFPNNPANLHVHCIGHSLGAHTCAHAGAAAAQDYPFDRITGLDPANLFFEGGVEAIRIDPSDAKYVDAMHTSAGIFISASFGIMMPVGHIDFFVNGGSFQPGCPLISSLIWSVIGGNTDILTDPTKEVGCSHNLAQMYFIESINSVCSFNAYKCQSKEAFDNAECTECDAEGCAVLGYYADRFKATGSYYINTKKTTPFCGYNYMFNMNVNSESPKTAGEINITLNTNNNPISISLTPTDYEIKAGNTIKKIFVSDIEITESTDVELKFTKRPKPLLSWSDPNSLKFNFDSVLITNLEIKSTLSSCESKKEIVDKTPIKLNLKKNSC